MPQVKERPARKQEDKTGTEAKADPKVIKKGEELKKDLSELMDKIDDTLMENAEQFVKNYVQKGGE